MLIEFLHQADFLLNKRSTQKQPLVISLDNYDARERADEFQALIIPRPLVDYIAQADITVGY
jgi:hypothetical protein